MKLKPLTNKLVVKMILSKEITKSGIILTGSTNESPQFAEVIAVGDKGKENQDDISVGNKVVVTKFSGTTVKLEDEEYVIINRSDVLAVIE